MRRRFSLRDVATYYSGQLHQKEALDMLQNYIPESIEERFADMWREGKKNEIPSHVSWLPLLQRWLPASWVTGGSVSAKAAKADRSPIPKRLWDLRISLVLDVPSLPLITVLVL